MDPGYLVGGEVRSTGANAGWGAGEWLVVEADESDRSLLKLDRRDRRAHERRARPPHDLRSRARRRRRRSARSWPRAEQAVVWDRPELLALAGDAAADAVRRAGAGAGAGRLALRARRRRGRAVGPRRPQRPQRRRRADRLPARRRRPVAAAAAALRDFTGAGRRFERLGTTAAGALVVDDYAHHPTEVRGHDRGRPHARRRAASSPSSSRTCTRARAHRRASSAPRSRSPTSSSCSTIYPARERAGGLPGRHRPARRRGGRRRRRRAARRLAAGLRRGRGLPARRRCATATCCSRSARATSTRSAARCVSAEPASGV